MKIEFRKNEELKNVQITYNEQTLLLDTLLQTPKLKEKFTVETLTIKGNQVSIIWYHPSFGKIEQLMDYSSVNDDCLGNYSLRAISNHDCSAIISQTYAFVPQKEPYFMIPGTFYGTNNSKNSKSKQVQLNYRGDINYPKTPVLYTRADRSTHNAVISIFNDMVLGIRINESTDIDEDYYYNGLGIDTLNFDPFDRIAVTIGFQHFPVHYYGKLGTDSHTDQPERSYIPFKKEVAVNTFGHIYCGVAKNRFAYEKVITAFYNTIHQPPENDVSRNKAIEDLTHALLHDAFSYKYNYFPTVLSGGYADTGIAGDSGWTGGMQVVYPLVRASKFVRKTQNFTIEYINNFIANAVNPKTGFFYENKDKDTWNVSGWWKDDLILYNRKLEKLKSAHSAYVNGQACCYLLKSYQFAKTEGWKVKGLESWLATCKEIVDNVIEQQRYDGALGVYFDPENGEAVYYNSFQGVWFLAAIAELAKITRDSTYFEIFNNANRFYYKFLENVELWGTPIDTRDAVDEEGNLAYVTALKTMHEINDNEETLEQLMHALHYEFSWKFAYNTKFKNEPLKSLNWSSCGGSITSSHNIHIHQMGNLIAEEIYYAYKQTNDDYILDRLKDTLNWGLGTYNREDGYFGYGKKGWATEQFFHSDGKQDDPARIVDGGIWYDYLSWAAACVLLSLVSDIQNDVYVS